MSNNKRVILKILKGDPIIKKVIIHLNLVKD